MAIRAVLFDWDGTLVKSSYGPAFARAAGAVEAYARKYLGVEPGEGEFERAFNAVLPAYSPGEVQPVPTIGRVVGEAFTWLGWAAGANDVEACGRLFFDAGTLDQEVYDDARAILASLKYRGFAVGVITNAIFPANYFQKKVNELGLAGYVDAFVSSADVGLGKPHPAPFQRALGMLEAEPHEALFVGDTPETDIAGARGAGLRAVLLERQDRARDRAGFLVIERLSALNDLLGEGTRVP
jgi:putative hydrolase of the HAD superfamily